MSAAVPLLRARGLGKSYPRVARRRDRMRSLFSLLAGGRGGGRISVLADVDLDVYRGQSVGLIGVNGAGKSTLLKLITGVLNPSTGTVEVEGRIGALLELGAGFHPEYTGRENVAMAAALYGLTAAETEARMDDILAFADIGAYIDEPVKHYSSGMVVRLGFAVVAAAKPDLLITDEVLAVGDEAFQKKCIQWIEAYLEGGGTLLLVSHSMYHIQKLCQHAMWLHEGQVQAQGDVFDVTQAYLAWNERRQAQREKREAQREQGEFSVLSMRLNDTDALDVPLQIRPGDDVCIQIELRSRDGRVPACVVSFARGDGGGIYGVGTDMDGVAPELVDDGRFRVEVVFPNLSLLPGQYVVRAHAMDPEAVRLFDTMESKLTVRGASREQGFIRLAHQWRTPEA